MNARAHRIGFIGAGTMGRPMIGHLAAAGHRVVVHARRDEMAAALRADGFAVERTPVATAKDAEVVFLNVTTTADVEAVLFGADGVVHGAPRGAIVIDHSTISPVATRAFAARLADAGLAMLDAPVSGGEAGARAGTLSIMVGGDADVLERVRPLLATLGRTITHIGPHGAGQVAKACNQIVQVVNIQGIAEAMLFAAEQGAPLDRVLVAISAGMAGSRMLDLMGPRMAARDFAAGIEARLHAKDFGLVAGLADELGLVLPAVRAVAAQLEALLAAGYGRDDTSSLLRVLEAAQPGRDVAR